ncbi:hypothetical protein V2J09_004976 [Rumex salicifolius]
MKGNKPSHILVMMALSIFMQFIGPASGQANTPCSSSMIRTFTPCMNYVTGSSYNTSSSPTTECCNSLGTIISDSIDCACLIITANVPLPTTFGVVNRALVVSLPGFCNSPGVPVLCKAASGSPLPSPGPVLFAPPPPSDISPGGPQAAQEIASLAPAASPSKTSSVKIRTVMSPFDSSPSCTISYTPTLMSFMDY